MNNKADIEEIKVKTTSVYNIRYKLGGMNSVRGKGEGWDDKWDWFTKDEILLQSKNMD